MKQQQEIVWSNGLQYAFVTEDNGSISVYKLIHGDRQLVTTADNKRQAEAYISFIEPLPPGIDVI